MSLLVVRSEEGPEKYAELVNVLINFLPTETKVVPVMAVAENSKDLQLLLGMYDPDYLIATSNKPLIDGVSEDSILEGVVQGRTRIVLTLPKDLSADIAKLESLFTRFLEVMKVRG